MGLGGDGLQRGGFGEASSWSWGIRALGFSKMLGPLREINGRGSSWQGVFEGASRWYFDRRSYKFLMRGRAGRTSVSLIRGRGVTGDQPRLQRREVLTEGGCRLGRE